MIGNTDCYLLLHYHQLAKKDDLEAAAHFRMAAPVSADQLSDDCWSIIIEYLLLTNAPTLCNLQLTSSRFRDLVRAEFKRIKKVKVCINLNEDDFWTFKNVYDLFNLDDEVYRCGRSYDCRLHSGIQDTVILDQQRCLSLLFTS